MIFVIDDEKDLADIVQYYLETESNVKIFTSISEALPFIHEANVVICDYHVKNECGFQFFKSVREDTFVKVLMTGEPIDCLPKDMRDYVDSIWSKPLTEANKEEAKFLGSSCF